MGLTSGISAIDGARVGEATLDLICSLIALLWAYMTRNDDDKDNDDNNNNGNANEAIEQAPNPQEQAEGNAPDNEEPEIEPPPPPLTPPQPDEEDKQPEEEENAPDNVTDQPEIKPPPPPEQPEEQVKQPEEEETVSDDDSDDDEPIFCPGLTHPDHVFPRTSSSPPPLRRRKQQEGDGFMRKFRSLFRSSGKFEIDPEDPFRPTSAMEDAMSTLKHFAMAPIFTVGSEGEKGGSGVGESSLPTDDGESAAVVDSVTPVPQMMYPCTDETDSMDTQEPGCSSASVPGQAPDQKDDGQESAAVTAGETCTSADAEESNLDRDNNSIPTTASNSVAEIDPQPTDQGVISPRRFGDVNPLDSSPSRPHTAGGHYSPPLGDAEVPSTSRQIHSAPGNASRILIPSSNVPSTPGIGSVIPPVDVDVKPSSSHVLDQLGFL
ncbi:nucleolin 2-like [Folsomia candida]|uniref:nucleolin 2-like n=1 Tax=Folsomia candida TaxID=158441 RepID=UPI0016054CBA|nr:nucleolin 2-like [Folsomia candida]